MSPKALWIPIRWLIQVINKIILISHKKFWKKIFTFFFNIEIINEYFQNIGHLYNTSQFNSIKDICMASEGICLLQGPPGTGKTFTLMGIVSGMFHYIKNSPSVYKSRIMVWFIRRKKNKKKRKNYILDMRAV